MTHHSSSSEIPRVGMLATVRNRRGLIVSVTDSDARPDGILRMVRIEYTDGDGAAEDTLLWDREHNAALLEPTAMPRVADEPPMFTADFDALVRATRWSALTPFIRPDGSGEPSELPIASPFFGAVQVEDFQLVPLLKALQMPRVSLLLADDVGLGKTIEAGLILTELLLRRRIRRVLILSPASLRRQWQQEMRDKFSLSFDLIDREETHALQARLGLDANPWRTFPRIIASYYYLRQPDVLEQFLSVCRAQAPGAYQLPWDLLVVDEAHNLMPSSFGDDSDLSKMLRAISPYFEHKLLLTATPHNGHTRSFTGLLEQLDPVRFTQTNELTPAMSARVEDVLVRRLKSEINALDDSLDRPRRFADRYAESIPLFFSPREKALSEAFSEFRTAVKLATARAKGADRNAGSFAVEVLNKRLLSCPSTFAESWLRFRQGLSAEETVSAAEVSAARRSSEEDIDDDREREGRAQHAARTVGAWLKPLAGALQKQIDAIDTALRQLGIEAQGEELSAPKDDARFDRLMGLIEKYLRKGKKWVADERIIVFTEYKTTLDYLERRLLRALDEDRRAVRVLYGGGMTLSERESIREAFNDPSDPVRVLVATDAAAEGLNLQETARYVLHYEVPWNPSRLEQRNGRLDRHGQARDVTVWHFASEDDADLKFLDKVVGKVHAIRDDLGSMGEVFDAAFQRRFKDLEDTDAVVKGLDMDVERRKNRARLPRQPVDAATAREAERLAMLGRDVDLCPETLRGTLEVALGIEVGHPRIEGPDARGRMKLAPPVPTRWRPLIDDTLRLPPKGGDRGALPGIVFDPKHFIQMHGSRPVFRPAKDTVLLHLGHPVFREALSTFARLRFPGEKELTAPSRWTVRRGEVPLGAYALILLTVEELAVNELREPFHHWVRTLRIPVENGVLGKPEGYVAPADERLAEPLASLPDDALRRRAGELWEDISLDLRDALRAYTKTLTAGVRAILTRTGKHALVDEKKRYQDRIKEVEAALQETSLAKIKKEIEKRRSELLQGALFEDAHRRQIEEELRNAEDEYHRRSTHYRELLDLLRAEQDRVLTRMLPKRYELRGDVQVFPVTVEIRFPGADR